MDWEAREVRIRRKLDVRTGEEIAGTKSDAGVREVPIHPHLMPLLKAMHREAADEGARVLPVMLRPGSSLPASARAFEDFADQTRTHLKAAGSTARSCSREAPTSCPSTSGAGATTGCTWLAMLGTDSYVIALQAGHKSPDTTWGSYIKRGPDLRQRYGEPFPELPASLLKPSPAPPRGSGQGFGSEPKLVSNQRAFQRRGRESKPAVDFDPRSLSKGVPSATRSPLPEW